MSGIRLTYVPYGFTDKDIKVHFANPNNGGGDIKAIYYPLFQNHAVVMFEDEMTAETVGAHKHIIQNHPVFFEKLPAVQVFTTLEATLDPTVAAFLQVTDEVRDEIQYSSDLEFCYDTDKNLTAVRGNWYLLEWFWAHIQRIMEQQTKFVSRVTGYIHSAPDFTSPSRRPASPVWLEDRSRPLVESGSPIISLPTSAEGSLITPKLSTTQDWREPRNQALSRDDEEYTMSTRNANQISLLDSDSESSDSDKPTPLVDKSADDTLGDLSTLNVSGDEDPASNQIVILRDNPDDPRTLDFKYGHLTVSIYTGYITMAETDAIVNAAMGPLINAGGVAGAIAKAADPDMQRQCDEYVKKHGSVPTAGVMHTCAGGKISSSVKYVIHTVGPVWSSSFEDKCRRELTLSFLNSMKYGNDVLKIKSITMPVISSGIFGCPLEMCVRSFFNAVLLFSSDHAGDSVTLRELHLINNHSDSTVTTVLQLRGLIGQDTGSLIAAAKHEISQNVKDRGYGLASLSTERTQRLTTDALSSTRYETDIQSPYLRSRQHSDSGVSSFYLSTARDSGDIDSNFKSSPGSNASLSGMRNLANPASVSSTGFSHRSASGGNMYYSPTNYRDELDRDYSSPSASGQRSLDNLRLDTSTSPLITSNTGKARSTGPPTFGMQSISTGLTRGGDIRRTVSPVSPVASVYQPSHLHLSRGFSGDMHTYDDRAHGLDKDISAREPRTLGRPLPAVPKTATWK